MPITPPENKESARASNVRKGHQGSGGEMCGSSDKNGVRFKVHDHPDYSCIRTPEKR